MNSLGNKKLDDLQKQFLQLSKQSMVTLAKQKKTTIENKKLTQQKKPLTSFKPKSKYQSVNKLNKKIELKNNALKPKKEITSNIQEQQEIQQQQQSLQPNNNKNVESPGMMSPITSARQFQDNTKENQLPNPYGICSITARSYNSHFDLSSQQFFPRDNSLIKYCPQSPVQLTKQQQDYAETLNLSSRQFSPKFYHQHMINKINYRSVLSSYSKDLQSPQKSILLDSSRRDFVSENKQSILIKNLNSARSYNKSQFPQDNQSLYNPTETSTTILHFYTDVLRTLESLRFSVTNSQQIELIIEQAVSQKNDQILIKKLGIEGYKLVKQLYVCARKECGGEEGVKERQVVNIFDKGLRLFGRIQGFDQHQLEIIIQMQLLKRKIILFQDFVEILYSVSKLAYQNEELTNDERFRKFMEYNVKNSLNMMMELNEKDEFPEQIRIFFEPYNPFQNPAVQLFYENHNFLKHVFSLYESTNIQYDKEENFISLKNFLKLCKHYLVVPNFCRIQQATKIFRAFQKGKHEILSFTGLIITLSCIAHTSFILINILKLIYFEKGFANSQLSAEFSNFYLRIQKVIETMKQANNDIAEELMQQAFTKYRE